MVMNALTGIVAANRSGLPLEELVGALPRVRLGIFPTPLTRAHRIERALGIGPLLIKRDDLAGFGVAGNKTRPLEFLLGEARARGADVVVTGGGPGSNFCPAAAMAATAVGLECELVVWGEPRGPNLALARAAGARVLSTGDRDRAAVDELVRRRAAELTVGGRCAYPVPRGGSTPLGAVGFALAAAELARQLAGWSAEWPELIVLPVGSGGSCAGLLAGLNAIGLDIPVLGVSVSRPPAQIHARVTELAAGCARMLGIEVLDASLEMLLEIIDARGPGFGVASELERERALGMLRSEGLPLDATYGAETLSAALDRAASGPVLFWHTGGLIPAVTSITEGVGT
jgi:1-aminocyclopropane-1-carboxylate deaminase/D-cysteine desulfhydrase-like pyridoxal-dependent ACC family enzyme